MANFPILSPDQASPGLWGAQRINDIFKAMQENQYYGRNIESEILNRNQHSNLLGEQAQWYGPKSRAEIDLINKGYIPHYLAQNRLIDQGQIPHFQSQNRLLGEQAEEQGFKNKFTGSQWNQWKRLQDEIDAMNSGTQQQSQMSENIPDSYFTPEMRQQLEESNRIVDLRNAGKNVRQAINEPTLNSALNPSVQQQGQMGMNNSASPPPQVLGELLNQINQQKKSQQQMPAQQLGEAQQQFQSAAQPAMQQPFNKEQRIAELRAQQRAIFGNFGNLSKGVKAGTETPEEKRQGQISVAQEKENIKEAAKDAEKAELASEASQVAEGALNKMLESSKRIATLQSGWLGGHSPGVSDARQEFDQASAVLQKSVMDSMKGQGQMSQAKMSFIESLKPNSKMNEKVREKVAHTLLSVAKRSGERITFNAAATDAGFDPKQTKVLWKLYNNERPEYDSKNQKPIDENLNTFSDFINNDALDAAIHGKSYSPKKQGEEPNNDMVMVVAQNGQKGMIPKGKLDEALKRGARLIQ